MAKLTSSERRGGRMPARALLALTAALLASGLLSGTAAAADNCPNNLARQQTGSAALLDCRAYELVSAPDTGGYDVSSDLVPDQELLDSYPEARGRALYSIHFGAIPGLEGSPPNLGGEPYLATRGASGWSTRYVGLPADGMADAGPFASRLLGATPALDAFAFGGEGICAPCFEDGSTNLPLRLPDGSLVKGMAGSLNPSADPAGEIRAPFSADGTHFVFGAAERFEPAGNEGSVSIYSRNLVAGETEVASTMPDGSTMTGTVAQLAISTDGSHVLIGKLVSTDAEGNEYFDLYMYLEGSAHSLEVLNSPSGAIFNGMSADGEEVIFTTPDALVDDTDSSPDLFRATLNFVGATISRVSTGIGGTGNTDSCTPIEGWNLVSGGPNCGTLAFAGGAGMAASGGAVYFLSPEKLGGAANGEQDMANLYLARPGETPHFVMTLDTTAGKPAPPPGRPVENASLISGLSNPSSLAVDQSNGDIYVAERGDSRISRYTSAGAPKDFTAAQPYVSGNQITGVNLGGENQSQIAFDSSPASPLQGSLYVANWGGPVSVYASSGELLGTLSIPALACGVAVDQSTGSVYVGDFAYEGIRRFDPLSAATPLDNSNYAAETSIKTPGINPCSVSADSAGHVYARNFNSGQVKRYDTSEFAAAPPTTFGALGPSSSRALYSDPENGDLYVDDGNEIARYDPSGTLLQRFGGGSLGTESRSVAINAQTKHVYADNGSSIVEFGFEPIPAPIDNPAVEHGVDQSAVHDYGDFQVSSNGHYAAFASATTPAGFPATGGRRQVYRYDAVAEELTCVSCPPDGGTPSTHAALASHGLGLLDDGRVFFNSREALVIRDSNKKQDAYEWKQDEVELISPGLSPYDSGLLGASSEGTDVFFFTRDVLAPQDKNGASMKLYDARSEGGFFAIPGTQPCAAADECHGPGTQAAPPPPVGTLAGTPGQFEAARRCAKGKVKRRGRCVPRRKSQSRKRGSQRAANAKQGGRK